MVQIKMKLLNKIKKYITDALLIVFSTLTVITGVITVVLIATIYIVSYISIIVLPILGVYWLVKQIF